MTLLSQAKGSVPFQMRRHLGESVPNQELFSNTEETSHSASPLPGNADASVDRWADLQGATARLAYHQGQPKSHLDHSRNYMPQRPLERFCYLRVTSPIETLKQFSQTLRIYILNVLLP